MTARRSIIRAARVLSLLLALATVGVYVRTYLVLDHIERMRPGVMEVASTAPAAICFLRFESPSVRQNPGTATLRRVRYGVPNPAADGSLNVLRGASISWQWLAFDGRRTFKQTPRERSVSIVVPLWPSLLIFSLAPAAWAARRSREGRRRANSRCVACGYDLRASPGRCPECGADGAR